MNELDEYLVKEVIQVLGNRCPLNPNLFLVLFWSHLLSHRSEERVAQVLVG